MPIQLIRSETLKKSLSPSHLWAHVVPFITLIHYQRAITQLLNELLEAEDELTLFREILSASSDPILITDPQMKIVYVNHAWEKMSGYTFNEVVAKDVAILEREKTPKKIYQNIWRSLNQNKPYRTEEVIEKKKDGSECQVYSSFFPVQKNRRTIFYVQIQHDITKRKRLENQKREFLATAAHELRTPVTTLRLLTAVLGNRIAKKGLPKKDFKELVVIDGELSRLTKLINDILDISRLEEGKFYIQLQEVNLKELLGEVIQKMRLITKNHKINLTTPDDITVFADPHRIEQVIVNLITNAAKFSPHGTPIDVSLKMSGKMTQVEVADHGIGIPSKELSNIFERFYQVKKHDPKGFGLGLYICHEIISQHRGKIWAARRGGSGTSFYFHLPIKPKI